MRMFGGAAIVVVALLGLLALVGAAPAALAAESQQTQPPPRSEVSLLAVSLTAGAALAALGCGIAQTISRRRTAYQAGQQEPGQQEPEPVATSESAR